MQKKALMYSLHECERKLRSVYVCLSGHGMPVKSEMDRVWDFTAFYIDHAPFRSRIFSGYFESSSLRHVPASLRLSGSRTNRRRSIFPVCHIHHSNKRALPCKRCRMMVDWVRSPILMRSTDIGASFFLLLSNRVQTIPMMRWHSGRR